MNYPISHSTDNNKQHRGQTDYHHDQYTSCPVPFVIAKMCIRDRGNGIFINTKVLHRLYSPSKALIPNFVFMPSFIAPCDSLIYQKYILPIISYPLPFLIFHKEVCWQAKVLSIMRQIISAQDSVSSKELLTSSLLQNLWLEIFENTNISYQEEHKEHSTASQARLQLMMQFIHLNYSQSISLDDIAEQAMVSKSTALNLFRKYLHITPVNYLICLLYTSCFTLFIVGEQWERL